MHQAFILQYVHWCRCGFPVVLGQVCPCQFRHGSLATIMAGWCLWQSKASWDAWWLYLSTGRSKSFVIAAGTLVPVVVPEAVGRHQSCLH